MAWIYRDKNGDLMFSKVKPEKVYIFRFKNCEIHKESESTWSPFPVTFKPETISALKPVVDLENLTIEDGLIEI